MKEKNKIFPLYTLRVCARYLQIKLTNDRFAAKPAFLPYVSSQSITCLKEGSR